MKEFKLKIAKAQFDIHVAEKYIVLHIETPIDHLNHNDINDITSVLQNKDAKISDSDETKYMVVKDSLSIGQNNILYQNEYERFISFDVIYFPKENSILDVSKWLDSFKNKELNIQL